MQIIIHNQHRKLNIFNNEKTWSEFKKDVAMLSLNYTITAVATGKLSSTSEKDYLAIGTDTSVLVYQVDDNLEVFFREISERICCMLIGSVSSDPSHSPLLLCGTRTSVKGFNEKGDDVLWIVVSSDVNSILLFDFNRDNECETLLACQDGKIRIYKNDKFLRELNENGPVTGIVQIGQLLAFLLSNGTVGVYEEYVRLWRIKSKCRATSAVQYDLLGTGQSQIVVGWENGKIDVRESKTGEVLMQIITPNKIVSLLVTDYRGMLIDELIVVTDQGDIQGYVTSTVNLVPLSTSESSQIRDLLNFKQQLLQELSHYENNSKVNDTIMGAAEDTTTAVNLLTQMSNDFAIIPANTRLQIGISTDGKQSSVEVSINTNNSTIIKAVTIFADGIFENGEVLIVHPSMKRVSSGSYSGMNTTSSRMNGVSNIVIPLKIPKDEPVDIHIKAFVGSSDSNQFHVFELNRQLPKFSMYAFPERMSGSPKTLSEMTKMSEGFSKISQCFVKIKVSERISRFCLFVNQSFLLPADIEPLPHELDNFDFFKLSLICLRDSSPLNITFYNDSSILIQTDNIELAGNLVQTIAQFMNIQNLDSIASFPPVVDKFCKMFEKLQGLQESLNVLRTDTALKVNLAKTLVLRAEDAKVTNV